MSATSVLAEELEEIIAAREKRTPTRRKSQAESEEEISFCNKGDRELASERQLCGLALSGGGIRSATFNLGVLQALAKLELLERVDYLSTVSGGGYIGAWLTAWVHRRRGGIKDVERELGKPREPSSETDRDCNPDAACPADTDQEQGPIKFLREHSNYLTPRMGFFGADTWSAVSIYLRNLVLNLTVLVGVLLAVLLVPRLFSKAFDKLSQAGFATQIAAFASLGFAVLMSAVNLRYVRKSAPEQASNGHEKVTWTRWFLQQPRVLLLIVFPATLGAFFVAASMRRTTELTLEEFLVLAVAYLALWLLLVLVWLPTRGSTGNQRRLGSQPSCLRRAWNFAQPILYAGLAALLAVALVERFTASFVTENSAAWMTGGVPMVIAIFTLSAVLHLGLMGRLVTEEVREWWSRLGGWLLIVMVAWVALCGISLYGPLGVQYAETWNIPAAVAWLATTGFGVLAGRSPSTNGKQPSRLVELVAGIAPYVFVLGLLIALSALAHWGLNWAFLPDEKLAEPTSWNRHWAQLDAIPWHYTAGTAFVCLCGALLLSSRVDVNDFSLQPFYRNRLVRCYLGASRQDPLPRAAHPFTGFDPDDDIYLADLARKDRALQPYPLINVALNLVKGENLAWQERKAASFTMGPLHCGFGQFYRRTAEYAGGRLTLGEAFATSGAAASPNMGYHSSPALAFLMTVFNVRLGMWLPNPKSKSQRWKAPGPRFGIGPLLAELFGNTNENAKFAYLSDGGHFDNLGIYELVRRRCRFIIACDASADAHVRFDDLGAVIRKCRTDFGVNVDLDTASLQRDTQTGRCRYYCAVGKVEYPAGTSGTLVYLKAALTGHESVDVLNYAAADALFPHQNTADQWFSESQFESYRHLGNHCGNTVFEAAAKDHHLKSLETVFTSLRERWYPASGLAAGMFTRHAATLDELHERMRNTPELLFLDAQIYPSWPELMANTSSATSQLWLPKSAEARRHGFYFCTSLIQLMENVYTDLNLGTQFDHPDNRGWMNLFKHWSWCGMLRVTWAITAATYGARFQTFCRERLGLSIGSVEVIKSNEQQLNPVERTRLGQLENQLGARPILYTVKLRVSDPLKAQANGNGMIAFSVGFALADAKRLQYMRIQDHLRKMGLARGALESMLTEEILDPTLVPLLLKDPEEPGGEVTLQRLFDCAAAEYRSKLARAGSR